MDHVTDHDQGKLRKAAGDGAQAAIWVWVLVMFAVVTVLGVAWGLRHRVNPLAPDLRPELPTLPGKTPEPQNP